MIQVKIVIIVIRKKDQDLNLILQIVKKKTLLGVKRKKNVPIHHRPHFYLIKNPKK